MSKENIITKIGNAGWSGRQGHVTLVKGNELFVMTGLTGNYRNDVYKTTDLINWTQVLANGNGQFTGRAFAAGVV